MGNFIGNLAKGFVRSAVNQVGRDGGRVISNQLYGDAHSIPIRNISTNDNNQYVNSETNKILSDEELRDQIIENGFVKQYCSKPISTMIIWFILGFISSCIFFPLGFLYFIILLNKGIKKIFQKDIRYVGNVNVANYVQDKRYKSNTRFNGYINKEVSVFVKANDDEKTKLRKIGITYIILGTIIIAGTILIIYFFR